MTEAAPRHFASRAAFRKWLAGNHRKARQLWIAFYRKHTGKRGLTCDQAVEEALCFGWIDGLRKAHDEESFRQRFTPRRTASFWVMSAKREETRQRRLAQLVADSRRGERIAMLRPVPGRQR